MPTFPHDSLAFHYLEKGRGLPFLFQHGLGGDATQPQSLYDPPPGLHLLSMDFRAHGETRPLGDPRKIAIAPFADDLIALLDHLRISTAIVGGISLGAAVALHLALHHPSRVRALVLVRPAWLDRPLPDNTRPFSHVAQHLLKYGPADGLARYQQTPEYHAIAAESPDTARSLSQQFLSPRAEECVIRLERLPHDAPAHDREDWRTLRVPTLILANHRDPLHPWPTAATLAAHIPGSQLSELTPKSTSLPAHLADLQSALDTFLRPFLTPSP